MGLRLFSLAGTYLIGYAVLWIGWLCYRRPITRVAATRGLLLAFVAASVFLQFAGTASYLKGPNCLIDGCFSRAAQFPAPGTDILRQAPTR